MNHDIQQKCAPKEVDVTYQELGRRRLHQIHPIYTESVTQYHQMYSDSTVLQQSYSKAMIHQDAQTYRAGAIHQQFNNREIHPEVDASPQPPNKAHVFDFRNKTYKSKIHLPDQYNKQAREKIHICNVCHKGFTSKKYLKQHLLIHTRIKPYVCEVCNKSFSLKRNLRTHSLLHSGQKPHVCNICQRGFVREEYLTRHYLTHTGKMNNFCGICNESFAQDHFFRAHYLFHERDVKGFSEPSALSRCSLVDTDHKTDTKEKWKKTKKNAEPKLQADRIIIGITKHEVVRNGIPDDAVYHQQPQQEVTMNQSVNHIQIVPDYCETSFPKKSAFHEEARIHTEQQGYLGNAHSLATTDQPLSRAVYQALIIVA